MNWLKLKLGDLCLKITDGSHNPPKGIDQSEYLMLSSKNVYDDEITFYNPRYLSKDDFEKENKRTDVCADDVLLTIVGTVGRAAVVPKGMSKFTLQRSVAVFKPNVELITSRFLMFSLQNILDTLMEGARGVAQKGIYLKTLREIQILVPPVEEQKRIAAILDKADAIRRKRQQAIDLTDQLLRSVFLDMFGDPVTNPKGWEQLKMAQVLDLITYGLTVRPKYVEEGIHLISAKEIRSGNIDFDRAKLISEIDFQKLSDKGKPKKNEILFSKTGSIGHCAIIETDSKFAITQNAARLLFKKDKILSKFALYFLRTDRFQFLAKSRAKGNAVKDLQLGDMKEFLIYCPPVSEQERFIEILKKQQDVLYKLTSSCNLAMLNFDSLTQQAFNGQLSKPTI